MAVDRRVDEFIQSTRPILEAGNLDELVHHLQQLWTNSALCELLSCHNSDACKIALFSLALIGRQNDCPSIISLLNHRDSYIVKLAEHALWSIWLRGNDVTAQVRLQESIVLIAHDQLQEAIDRICLLIDEHPDYAEAYHQRAIAEFLAGEYDLARSDLMMTLHYNPYHFAAIAGLGHCDAAEGFRNEALDFYREALQIHPQAEGLRQAIEELQNIPSPSDQKAPSPPIRNLLTNRFDEKTPDLS